MLSEVSLPTRCHVRKKRVDRVNTVIVLRAE